MTSKEELQREIELARKDLDSALGDLKDIQRYYDKSVRLDKLIERYIDLCANEKMKA